MNDLNFRLTHIDTVMLGVRELAPSVAFYRDRLGLVLRNEIPGFAFLEGGNVTLGLSEPLAQALGAGAGAMEIVFAVDHVREAYTALQAKGITFVNEPRNVTGLLWAANFADPDGHRLSIFGPE